MYAPFICGYTDINEHVAHGNRLKPITQLTVLLLIGVLSVIKSKEQNRQLKCQPFIQIFQPNPLNLVSIRVGM